MPLCDRAVAILKALKRDGDRVFNLSNMAMLQCLRGLRPGLTVHGFRSTFMDWSHEQTAFPKVVIDMALAHAIGDKVEAAYRRGDLFEQRARVDEGVGRIPRQARRNGRDRHADTEGGGRCLTRPPASIIAD